MYCWRPLPTAALLLFVLVLGPHSGADGQLYEVSEAQQAALLRAWKDRFGYQSDCDIDAILADSSAMAAGADCTTSTAYASDDPLVCPPACVTWFKKLSPECLKDYYSLDQKDIEAITDTLLQGKTVSASDVAYLQRIDNIFLLGESGGTSDIGSRLEDNPSELAEQFLDSAESSRKLEEMCKPPPSPSASGSGSIPTSPSNPSPPNTPNSPTSSSQTVSLQATFVAVATAVMAAVLM